MARAPNEKVAKAKSLYLEGIPLVEISTILEIPAGTIRSWKNRYKWDGATQQGKRNVADEKTKKKDYTPPAVKSVMENEELTDQQRMFCLLFSKSFNATQSYIKAYEVDYKTASSSGARLLANGKIKAEIGRLKAERYTKAYLSEEDIFQRYMDIAFSDIGDYVWFGREMVPVMGPFGPVQETLADGTKRTIMKEINSVRFREATEVDTSLLAEVKQGKDGSSIKLMDRMKALDWLADHIGMATDKQKLEMQLIKTQIESKAGTEGSETEDDGFLDALAGKVVDLWQDE